MAHALRLPAPPGLFWGLASRQAAARLQAITRHAWREGGRGCLPFSCGRVKLWTGDPCLDRDPPARIRFGFQQSLIPSQKSSTIGIDRCTISTKCYFLPAAELSFHTSDAHAKRTSGSRYRYRYQHHICLADSTKKYSRETMHANMGNSVSNPIAKT